MFILLLAVSTSCSRVNDRPNIILITLDTTRRDHLSCYGYERTTSPNLDALAEEGALYDNCLSMTSWTLPSHASLFTGLYTATHGAHFNEKAELSLHQAVDEVPASKEFRANGLGEQAVTLAETLGKAGYQTGGIGGGPWLEPVFGLAQGFEYYDCDDLSFAGRTGEEINALAFPFIRTAVKSDRPFFLFLNYFDPHGPYNPPGPYLHEFAEARQSGRSGSGMATEISKYDGEILYVDHNIGAIFGELKRRGVWDDTWIIVTADHGEQFNEKGYSGHGFSLFEETLRIPLIMKTPKGWGRIGDRSEMIQLVNIMPTILDRLGIEAEAPMDAAPMGGRSDVAVAELYKNLANVKFNVLGCGARFDRNLKAVYWGKYKLIRSTKEKDEDAGLFDLTEHPLERRDLNLERPDLALKLLDAFVRWQESLTPPLSPRTIDEVDAETEELLKGLGY